jgi:hypothetical protein
MMVFIEALQKWRHYVMDRPIVAQTDSKFVEHTNTQKATVSWLARWWEIFSEYNVRFEHIAGQKNIVADALSRNLIVGEGSSKMAGVLPKSVNSHSQTCNSMLPAAPPTANEINVAIINEKFKLDYTGDKEFGKIWQHFRDTDSLVNGNVRIGGLVCVPKKDRQFILKACHESEGHPGGNKLANSVMERFYWHRVHKDSKHFAEACPDCQANEADHNKP